MIKFIQRKKNNLNLSRPGANFVPGCDRIHIDMYICIFIQVYIYNVEREGERSTRKYRNYIEQYYDISFPNFIFFLFDLLLCVYFSQNERQRYVQYVLCIKHNKQLRVIFVTWFIWYVFVRVQQTYMWLISISTPNKHLPAIKWYIIAIVHQVTPDSWMQTKLECSR